jgi:hypothetical protein
MATPILPFASLLLLFVSTGSAQMRPMISSVGINDPAREQLCIERAKKDMPGSAVPFVISPEYVERARKNNPDATFIAMDSRFGGPQLVECELSQGSGRFQPVTMTPENWFWHLVRPEGYDLSINTVEGQRRAGNICLETAKSASTRRGFDHGVLSTPAIEISLDRVGKIVAGQRAQRYDVEFRGTLFYRPANPDLTAVDFSCLLSPALKVKALQFATAQ